MKIVGIDKDKIAKPDYFIDNSLPRVVVAEEAIVLPMTIYYEDGNPYDKYRGGVLRKGGIEVKQANLYRGGKPTPDDHCGSGAIIMAPDPKINLSLEEVEISNTEVIYGGAIVNHYGHFLLETLTRLWNIDDYNDSLEVVFLYYEKPKKWHLDLLKAVGIDEKRIKILEKPTQFKKIHIAEPCLRLWSGAYSEGITRLAALIKKQIDMAYRGETKPFNNKKIYLSRAKVKDTLVFGEEFIEKVFSQAGWEIIHPEKLTIYEQLYIYLNNDYFSGIIGSAFHSLILRDRPANVIYINRFEMFIADYLVVDHLLDNNAIYIFAMAEKHPDAHPIAGPFLIDIKRMISYLLEEKIIQQSDLDPYKDVIDLAQNDARKLYEAHIDYNKATLHMKKQEYELSYEIFSNIEKRIPYNIDISLDYLTVLQHLNKYDEAQIILEKILLKENGNAKYAHIYSGIVSNTNKHKEAVEFLNRFNPSIDDTSFSIVKSISQVIINDKESAEKTIRSVDINLIEYYDDFVQYCNIASILGLHDHVLKASDRMIEKGFKHTNVFKNRIVALSVKGKKDQCVQFIRDNITSFTKEDVGFFTTIQSTLSRDLSAYIKIMTKD